MSEIFSGKKINKWKVGRRISVQGRKEIYWECECCCGIKKPVLSRHLLSGDSKSCGCQRRKGRRHKQWRGHGDISGNFWDSIKRGAAGGKGRRTPVDFEITIEYAWDLFIQQGNKCALTGLPLVINYSRLTGPPHTASLDRIDPFKGYVKDNVQWLHKDVNMMKRTYDQDYFIEICSMIADKNRDRNEIFAKKTRSKSQVV